MAETFDPYHRWLGIPPKDQPPNHYRLLAIDLFESDREVIADAAELRIAHLRTYQLGKHSQVSQRLLNEIAAAKAVLLDVEKKAEYDRELRRETATVNAPPVSIAPPPPVAGNDVVAPQALALPRRHGSRVRRTRKRSWPLLAAVGFGGVALLVLLAFVISGLDEENIGPDSQRSPPAATSSPIAKSTRADEPEETPRVTQPDEQPPGSRVADAGDSPDAGGSSPPSTHAAIGEADESKPPADDAQSPPSPEPSPPVIPPLPPDAEEQMEKGMAAANRTEEFLALVAQGLRFVDLAIVEGNVDAAKKLTEMTVLAARDSKEDGPMKIATQRHLALQPGLTEAVIEDAKKRLEAGEAILALGSGDAVASSRQATVVSVGTGADGPIVIRDRYEVDSVTTTVRQSATSGATTLTVGNSSDFHAGDEVLIIAMRGADAGEHEFHRIASVGANSLELKSALLNSYDVSDSIAIQRVPNFTDVTVEATGELTAKAWNGWTGGIVAFRANGIVNVKTGGSIHADALGFRGGWSTTTGGHADGRQGQSYLGVGSQGDRNANGGGGGAGNCIQERGCGGGGGSYGSSGSNGHGLAHGSAGLVYGDQGLSKLMLGSGGGSGGSDDDGGGTASGGAGGAGGGIVFIAARSLVLSGSLTAAGGNGLDATMKQGEDESGGGGGGSGGSVYLLLGDPQPRLRLAEVVPGGNGGGSQQVAYGRAGRLKGGSGGYGVLRVNGRSAAGADAR